MKYRIYIDEVGNADLRSSDNPNHRFLSLTGVIIGLDYVRTTLKPQLESLKEDFFGAHPDEPVILHRKDLVNAHFPFHVLRQEGIRREFDERLLSLLADWKYSVITVCIDKKTHKDKYTVWQYDPYHYCLKVLLERYVLFLDRMSAEGDAIAESRGGKDDLRLKATYRRLMESGTEYISADKMHNTITSRELKVKPKTNNIAGLQLADLIAHSSRNQILAEKGLFKGELAPFSKSIIDILQTKYDRWHGNIYGKKFL